MDDPFNLTHKGISDPAILEAFRRTHREDFLTIGYQAMSGFDGPLPIGSGQTISQPSLVAYMTQLLQVESSHKVLEIGTGSGFQAAILSHLAQTVVTVEVIPSLRDTARKRLKRLGLKNIQCVLGNGAKGYSSLAPYHRIMVTAAAVRCPESLLDQLSPGGRMVIPIGDEDDVQYIYVYRKNLQKETSCRRDIGVRFVPFVI